MSLIDVVSLTLNATTVIELAILHVSVGRAVDQDLDPTREVEADVTLVLIHLVIAVISVMIVDVHQIVEDAVLAVTVLIVVRTVTVIGIGITDAIKTAVMTAMTDVKIERAMISGVKLARMRTVALSVAALPAVLLINTVAEPHLLMEREEDLPPVIQVSFLALFITVV